MPQNDPIRPGEVWLVGAGPGDPDLLTRKAERLIRAADIVFYDALVGPAVLDLVPPKAERIGVGKRSGRHSKDQGSINDLMLAAAQAGRRVVRLKGGDPSVFGRSTEEIEHLRAHGVPVQICPGITAASAAAANAGVSLTLRGLARRLQFVTAHARAGEALDLDWAALADPSATLAIYMGRAAAPEIARKLLAHGIAADTPVLIAVNVSLPQERLLSTRLDLLPLSVRALAEEDPALLLIGAAVRPIAETPSQALEARPVRPKAKPAAK
ncbi:uroporphyrinogen-III C-methyltransferase [Sphingomonas oleivorans]|uniref:uroporphyrinogen-III C-methyltransferase n=1 Tax=Sphingomonas oleivorans TaxID=1735121 RepID=A0A2T5FXA9_9SPHN|nr:uroporphyrinogen-III C-methyltransferase [Sphingomonas oleivorans]PTQ10771.1 uroporphyrinogen-III C-methyltransferase [Sphingomonas oleivorans]